MNQLSYFIRKEWLLLIRDWHGLLLLFVMPTTFILIMTFALQNQYSGNTQIDYYLVNQDGGDYSQKLARVFESTGNFKRQESVKNQAELRHQVSQDKVHFLIFIEPDFEKKLGFENLVHLYVAPGTTATVTQLVESNLQQQILRLYLEQSSSDLIDLDAELDTLNADEFVVTHSLYGDEQVRPSSVQQNVPSWLLFSMFFIAIPLSTTLIHERQQGTLSRLQTMGSAPLLTLFGKIIPYFCINLLQVVAMLLVGVFLVPVLGGDQLQLGASDIGLFVISASVSLAAVCYSLLIAQLASTVEQATIFSGVCNIIMAAIGGVMVPRFIMPPVMQELSQLSPMAWGLDGFFDILLRNGTVNDVIPEAAALTGFSLLTLGIALLLASKKART